MASHTPVKFEVGQTYVDLLGKNRVTIARRTDVSLWDTEGNRYVTRKSIPGTDENDNFVCAEIISSTKNRVAITAFSRISPTMSEPPRA